MGGYNGAGIYSRYRDWTDDRDAGIRIRADYTDIEMDGIAVALSNAICRDGQSSITANLQMGGHKLTGMAPGTGPGDSVTYEQVLLASPDASPSSSGQVIVISGDGVALTLESQSNTALSGPDLLLRRNSVTPLAGDIGGSILFDFEDSMSNQDTFARIKPVMVNPTDLFEEGALVFGVSGAGPVIDQWVIGSSALYPFADNGSALGASGRGVSDIFLGAGAIITFGAADVTISHSTNTLAFGGATTGYSFAGGPTTVAGLTATSLNVSGTSTVAGLTATSITSSGTLGVTGTSTLGTVNAGSLSGSSLNVSGSTTLNSLSVSGTPSFSGLTVSGALSAGSLSVSGTSSLGTLSSLTVSGALTAGSISCSGSTTISGTVVIKGTTVNGNISNEWDAADSADYVRRLLNSLGTTKGNILWYNTSWTVLAPP